MSFKIILIKLSLLFIGQLIQSLKVTGIKNWEDKYNDKDYDNNDGHYYNQKNQNQNNEKNKCDKCPGDTCVTVDNCLFYQVNLDYTNYGCSQCNKGYSIDGDLFGSGVCMKNIINNCVWGQNEPDINNGKPFCWDCKKNYILSNDRTNCELLPKSDRNIVNCVSYYVNDDGSTVCNTCNDGLSISEDGSTCSGECTIVGCTTCISVGADNFCISCFEGFIGVYSKTANLFTECLDCNTWKGRLLSAKVGCNNK